MSFAHQLLTHAKSLLRAAGLWDTLQESPLRDVAARWWHGAPERELQRDLAAFSANHGFFARAGRDADPNRKVLIVSFSDWVAQVKLESLLAKALQLAGVTPVILTYSQCARARRYHRRFGFDQFIYLDQWITPAMERSARDAARIMLHENTTFRQVLELHFAGARIGRHVLSSIVANLRNRAASFDDPQVQGMLQTMLPRAIANAWAADAVLEKTRPELALFLERGYLPFSEVFDCALQRGVRALQYVHSHRADALLLKKYSLENRDQHPFSLSQESWRHVRQQPWTAAKDAELMEELRGRYESGAWFNRKFLQVGKKLKSADEIRAQLGLDPGRKTAVIFTHVLWDATFFYGENLFDDYEQWLIETVRAACRNDALQWVIKLHPDYVWKMRMAGETGQPRDFAAIHGQIGALPPHVKIMAPETDISTFSLFGITDYGLTVRGTVGVELPCLGVPVFTAGTGRYSGLGFTHDSTDRGDYFTKLARLHTYPRLTHQQVELARKHAYALLRLRPCPFVSFQQTQSTLDKLGSPLDHNVSIAARTLEAFASAADVRSFAGWALGRDQDDYLLDWPADAGMALPRAA